MTPLRQRMLQEMRLRNFAPSTQAIYVGCVARYALHFGQTPDQLGPEHVHEYLCYLADECHIGSGTRKVTACALRFLYHKTRHVDWDIDYIPLPKEEHKLPVVLSPSEVERLLAAVVGLKHRLMLMLLYATGLRVAELTHLAVGDIDRERMVIHVRHGKGARDRPLRDARPTPAARIGHLPEGRASDTLAVPRPAARPFNHDHRGREGLPAGGRRRGDHQARHPPHLAPQLRHSPAGGRHRPALHPGSARTSLTAHHRGLPLRSASGAARDRQSPRDTLAESAAWPTS